MYYSWGHSIYFFHVGITAFIIGYIISSPLYFRIDAFYSPYKQL